MLRKWLLSKKSTNTRTAYRRDVLAFFEWADEFATQLGLANVFAAEQWHLDAYREYLANEEQHTRYHGTRKYTDATVARKLTSISSFYRYCVKAIPHLVPTNPLEDVDRPEVTDDSATVALSLDEARRLLDAARAAGVMTHALVGLLLTTGMRISEAVLVDTNDLDVEDGQRIVWVRRKGGKKAKLVVPAEVARAIDRYRRGHQGPLFRGPRSLQRIKRQQVDRILRKLAPAAGYVDAEGKPKTLTPHMLRHTAARLAREGKRDVIDIQQMLGHRDIKTTRRYLTNAENLQNSAVHTVAALLGADQDHDEETP